MGCPLTSGVTRFWAIANRPAYGPWSGGAWQGTSASIASAVDSLNGFVPVYLPEPPRYGFSRGASYNSPTRSLVPQHVITRRAEAVACSVSLSAAVVLVPLTICSAARAPVSSHSSLQRVRFKPRRSMCMGGGWPRYIARSRISCVGPGDGDATNTCRLHHRPGLSRFLAKTTIPLGRERFADSLNPQERRTRSWWTPVSRRRAK